MVRLYFNPSFPSPWTLDQGRGGTKLRLTTDEVNSFLGRVEIQVKTDFVEPDQDVEPTGWIEFRVLEEPA